MLSSEWRYGYVLNFILAEYTPLETMPEARNLSWKSLPKTNNFIALQYPRPHGENCRLLELKCYRPLTNTVTLTPKLVGAKNSERAAEHGVVSENLLHPCRVPPWGMAWPLTFSLHRASFHFSVILHYFHSPPKYLIFTHNMFLWWTICEVDLHR